MFLQFFILNYYTSVILNQREEALHSDDLKYKLHMLIFIRRPFWAKDYLKDLAYSEHSVQSSHGGFFNYVLYPNYECNLTDLLVTKAPGNIY